MVDRVRTLSVLFASLSFWMLAPAVAEGQGGRLFGQVVGDDGSALAGGTVTLEGQGGSRVQVADGGGRFRFLDLPPGSYSLRVELEGFSTIEYPNVEVRSARDTTLEVTLNLTFEDEIVVTATSALLAERRPKDLETVSNWDQLSPASRKRQRDRWCLRDAPPGGGANKVTAIDDLFADGIAVPTAAAPLALGTVVGLEEDVVAGGFISGFEPWFFEYRYGSGTFGFANVDVTSASANLIGSDDGFFAVYENLTAQTVDLAPFVPGEGVDLDELISFNPPGTSIIVSPVWRGSEQHSLGLSLPGGPPGISLFTISPNNGAGSCADPISDSVELILVEWTSPPSHHLFATIPRDTGLGCSPDQDPLRTALLISGNDLIGVAESGPDDILIATARSGFSFELPATPIFDNIPAASDTATGIGGAFLVDGLHTIGDFGSRPWVGNSALFPLRTGANRALAGTHRVGDLPGLQTDLSAALALRGQQTRLYAAFEVDGEVRPGYALLSRCRNESNRFCGSFGRYRVTVTWSRGDGEWGTAEAGALSGDTGVFWFFDPDNLELLVKVLDGCGVNGKVWVFAGGLTNVGTTILVEDTFTGATRIYQTFQGSAFAPLQDTEAFTCDPDNAAAAALPKPVRTAGGGLAGDGAACGGTAEDACLLGDRFRVEVDWRRANGGTGSGKAIPLTDDSGVFWFFSEQNLEMMVKVRDACSFNNRFWVFAGGLTNVEVTLRVTDTLRGVTKTYVNPLRTPFAPIQDTAAFATCP